MVKFKCSYIHNGVQKRGLSHAHILFILHPNDKRSTPKDIDDIISADLLQKQDDLVAYDTVVQYMIHGPCGAMNPNSPSMQDGKCTKYFRKMFNNATSISEDGYSIIEKEIMVGQ